MIKGKELGKLSIHISRTAAAAAALFPVQSQEGDGARKQQAVSGTAAT